MFRNKLLFLILIILLIIAIATMVLFWYLTNKKQSQNLNQNINNNYQSSISNTNLNANQNINTQPQPISSQPQISETEKLKAQLSKIALAFAERYGSYSNQSDFENLEDLMVFMSQNLKSETQNFINQKRSQDNESAIYYGITTKSLKTEIIDFSHQIGQAKFKVSSQRQEIVGSSVNSNVYYQDIELKFIKEAGVWVINEVKWK